MSELISIKGMEPTGIFMFQFDNDEPVKIHDVFDNGECIITIKEGFVRFTSEGKSFTLFIKEIEKP